MIGKEWSPVIIGGRKRRLILTGLVALCHLRNISVQKPPKSIFQIYAQNAIASKYRNIREYCILIKDELFLPETAHHRKRKSSPSWRLEASQAKQMAQRLDPSPRK